MNICICAATGYRPDQIDVFLKSLGAYCKDVKVHLLVNHGSKAQIEALGVELGMDIDVVEIQKFRTGAFKVFFNRSAIAKYYKKLCQKIASMKSQQGLDGSDLKKWLHVALSRYVYAAEIIGSYSNKDVKVMMADIRDIVFQGNPFELIKADSTLIMGVESITIAEQVHNKEWLETLYPEAYNELCDHRIICSGFTLGNKDAVLEYLDAMVDELKAKFAKVVLALGFDQGIHNYLVRSNTEMFNPEYHTNESGLIATIGAGLSESDIQRLDGEFVNQNGDVYKVVHQYDRYDSLTQEVNAKWKSVGVE